MQDYKKFSIDLANKAGKVMLKNFELGMKKEWKGDGTPLTATDTTINQMVIDAVTKEFPEHNILAEEGSDTGRQSEYTWVCDPVDGTIPFSHGVPTAVFSLALVKNGEPILGVIYDPFMDRLYYAANGEGATLNGTPIFVSNSTQIANSVIGLGAWRSSTFTSIKLIAELESCRSLLVQFMSVVYMGALVASGEFLAAFYIDKFPWDGAALKVIVEEAGGRLTSIWGDDQRFDKDVDGFIVSNGSVHDELLKLVNRTVSKRKK